MSPIEIVHGSLSFVAIIGLLASIWFVPKSRIVALLVFICGVAGLISSLLGIYLAVNYHHPKLIVAGLVTLTIFVQSARYGLRNFMR